MIGYCSDSVSWLHRSARIERCTCQRASLPPATNSDDGLDLLRPSVPPAADSVPLRLSRSGMGSLVVCLSPWFRVGGFLGVEVLFRGQKSQSQKRSSMDILRLLPVLRFTLPCTEVGTSSIIFNGG